MCRQAQYNFKRLIMNCKKKEYEKPELIKHENLNTATKIASSGPV